jgi:hypothetical protein
VNAVRRVNAVRWLSAGARAPAVAAIVGTLAVAGAGCGADPDRADPRPSAPQPPPAGVPAIACDRSIEAVAAPPDGYEPVLDAVALPLGGVLQPAEPRPDGWLFAKQGLLVRAGVAVQLTVDGAAAPHARIGWAQVEPPVSTLAVPACPGTGWLVWAGGYTVDAPRCVPVVVRSGGREARVAVAIGVACPG